MMRHMFERFNERVRHTLAVARKTIPMGRDRDPSVGPGPTRDGPSLPTDDAARPDQRRAALEKANEIRARRAHMKRELHNRER
jgi:hypothetical protein